MSDPNDLLALWTTAWQRLRRGAADRKSPLRFLSFATVSPDGLPEVRTVALRRADGEAAVIEVHTDTETPKIAALRRIPRAEILGWDPRARMQFRLAADVRIETGARVADAWASVPPAARVSYGTDPVPGTPIDHVYAYEKPPVMDRFAVLHCTVDHLDVVHLDTQHRRARFERADGWAGTWLAP